MIFSENKFLDIFTDYFHVVNKPTHIYESLIHHVYIKETLMKEFFTNATVEYIYVPDHDALETLMQENSVDFNTIP